MSPDNTKGEIMPNGESLMDWLWNTRFQKQNKTKILVLQLNCPGNFWGHCEKCQSLGLWLQGNLINRFEEEPGNLHFILVQRALIHFKKILYLFLPWVYPEPQDTGNYPGLLPLNIIRVKSQGISIYHLQQKLLTTAFAFCCHHLRRKYELGFPLTGSVPCQSFIHLSSPLAHSYCILQGQNVSTILWLPQMSQNKVIPSLYSVVYRHTQWYAGKCLTTSSLKKKEAKICRHYCCLFTQLCLALCDPMDCSRPGSSVHGILQARIVEWVAISFSRDLPDPGIKPMSPALQVYSLPSEPPRNRLTPRYFFSLKS